MMRDEKKTTAGVMGRAMRVPIFQQESETAVNGIKDRYNDTEICMMMYDDKETMMVGKKRDPGGTDLVPTMANDPAEWRAVDSTKSKARGWASADCSSMKINHGRAIDLDAYVRQGAAVSPLMLGVGQSMWVCGTRWEVEGGGVGREYQCDGEGGVNARADTFSPRADTCLARADTCLARADTCLARADTCLARADTCLARTSGEGCVEYGGSIVQLRHGFRYQMHDNSVPHGHDDSGQVDACCPDASLMAWLNAVLCPGRRRGEMAESSSSFLDIQGVMKQWVLTHRMEDVHGMMDGVEMVEMRLSKDVAALARTMEKAMQDVTTRGHIRQAFQSYNATWLHVANNVVQKIHRKLQPCELKYVAWIVGGESRVKKNGKLQAKSYPVVLGHLLAIVKLLDCVFVTGEPPQWAPRLFQHIGGETRMAHASRDVIVKGIGGLLQQVDVERFLRISKYSVSYVQPARYSMPFQVTNMAVDLRDGLKLCRLADCLLGRLDAFGELARYPAPRRVDRLHNMMVAVERLGSTYPLASCEDDEEKGEIEELCAQLVDGDKACTEGLLWHCFIVYEIPSIVNRKSLSMEIESIKSNHPAVQEWSLGVGNNSMSVVQQGIPPTDTVKLLFAWIGALGTAQGRCLFDGGVVLSDLNHRRMILEIIYEHYEDGKRRNSLTVIGNYSRRLLLYNLDRMLAGVGGLPRVVSEKDYFENHSVDPRAILSFIAVLNRRILTLSREGRAAIVIQRYWRKRETQKPGYACQTLRTWIRAATLIQRNVRIFLFKKAMEERTWSPRSIVNAIIRVQALWRGHVRRREFVSLKESSILIQRQWRRGLRLRAIKDEEMRQMMKHESAIVIQKHWRAYVCRQSFVWWKQAAIVVQSHWRMVSMRCTLLQQRRASVVIQKYIRRMIASKEADARQLAILTIQAHCRMYEERKQFLQLQQACLVVQKQWRAKMAFRLVQERRCAVLIIQRRWKACLEQKREMLVQSLSRQMRNLACVMVEFAHTEAAAVRIQRAWRHYCFQKEAESMRIAREKEKHQASEVIFAHCASFAFRKRFLQQREAALRIQVAWKEFYAIQETTRHFLNLYECSKRRVEYREAITSSSIIIQKYYRAYHVWKHHPRADDLYCIRKRLLQANTKAEELDKAGKYNPDTLGNRTGRALDALRKSTKLPDVSTLQSLEDCTACSTACCRDVLRNGGLALLMTRVFASSRDSNLGNRIGLAFACVANVFNCKTLADVAGQELLEMNSLEKLAELCFQHRDSIDLFGAVVDLFLALSRSTFLRERLRSETSIVTKLDGIIRILSKKLNSTASYLHKLEGQKGSDVSARQATKTLVSLKQQIASLQRVYDEYGMTSDMISNAKETNIEGKNTIVRRVLTDIQNVRQIE